MQTKVLAILALRILAVVVASQGFTSLAGLGLVWTTKSVQGHLVLIAIGSLAGPLLLAAVLWLLAPWLASRAVPETSEIRFDGVSPFHLCVVAFVVAGVLLVSTSGPGAIVMAIPAFTTSSTTALAHFCAQLLKLLLGLILVFAARPLSRGLLGETSNQSLKRDAP